MSLVNMADGAVKSHLVQQVQARGDDMARTLDRAQVPFAQELARQADEVVLNITRAEQDTIRDDQQPKEGEQGEEEENSEEKKKEPAPPAEEEEPEPRVGARRIDMLV